VVRDARSDDVTVTTAVSAQQGGLPVTPPRCVAITVSVSGAPLGVNSPSTVIAPPRAV
jgi:hypothetical protein